MYWSESDILITLYRPCLYTCATLAFLLPSCWILYFVEACEKQVTERHVIFLVLIPQTILVFIQF